MGNFSQMSTGMTVLFVALIIWSLIWKGLALWRAARRTDTVWFVIFMFLNTAGILEIIYYFLIAKTDKK
jgi:methionyl-tRNA synthetase